MEVEHDLREEVDMSFNSVRQVRGEVKKGRGEVKEERGDDRTFKGQGERRDGLV